MRRYELGDPIGAGGMGQVFDAWDPTLERKVAIKFIHDERSLSTTARRRLLLEAKAMARVSHPNVVHVYEAGEEDGRLFIAMELVRGSTLRAWLREQPRAPKEIITKLVGAGRGLAAAHREGIIHRDFKPENVLIDREGRPRVADFGLAGVVEQEPSLEDVRTANTRLTRTGAVAGTPAYMSPEQHLGDPLDASTDQYSLCVALYQGLFGRLPNAADSLSELVALVTSVERPTIPRLRGLSTRQRRALARGLSLERTARFPSMDALLAELAPRRVARRPLFVGAAIVVAGGAIAFAIGPGANKCDGAREQISAAWNDDTRGELEQSFASSGIAHAPATWERVAPALDRFATEWEAMARASCEATARGEQSDELLDLRGACLQRDLVAFEARLDLLRVGEASVVDRAIDVVAGLPSIEPCADVSALLAPASRARRNESAAAQAIEQDLAELSAAQAAHTADAAAAEAAIADATAIADAWLESRAQVIAGRIYSDVGRSDDAVTALERARLGALRLGDDALAVEAMLPLVRVRGVALAEHEAALELGEIAGATGTGIAFEGTEVEARWHNAVGDVLMEVGRYTDARARFEAALAIDDSLFGESDVRGVAARNRLAGALRRLGELEASETVARSALAIAREAYGPDHPDTASSWDYLGSVLAEAGALEEAEQDFREALRIKRARHGEDSVPVMYSLSNLGNAMLYAGDPEAVPVLEDTLARVRRWLPPDHPFVAGVLSSLGAAYGSAGRYTEAEAVLAEAVERLDAQLGARHADLAMPRINLGRVLHLAGRPADAVPILEAAVKAAEDALGPEHDRVAMASTELSTAYAGAGQADAAIAAGERAVAIRMKVETDAMSLGLSQLALGRALWGRDRERATRLVEAARDHFADSGSALEDNDAAIWLRDHANE